MMGHQILAEQWSAVNENEVVSICVGGVHASIMHLPDVGRRGCLKGKMHVLEIIIVCSQYSECFSKQYDFQQTLEPSYCQL